MFFATGHGDGGGQQMHFSPSPNTVFGQLLTNWRRAVKRSLGWEIEDESAEDDGAFAAAVRREKGTLIEFIRRWV